SLGIIEHQLEFPLAHVCMIDYLPKAIKVTIEYVGILQDVNRAQVVQVDAAEIFTEVQVFNLTLGRLIDVQPVLIKELDVDDAPVMGREAHMHPPNCLSRADKVACTGQWHL